MVSTLLRRETGAASPTLLQQIPPAAPLLSLTPPPDRPATHQAFDCDIRPGEDVLATVVHRYMPLVWHAVRSLVVGASSVTFLDIEDLVSCGVEGMIEAYHAFDSARGVRFSTYALPRIRGSILDALRSAHPLPRSLQELAAANDNATARLYSELGRTPTAAEVADHLGLPVEKFLSSLRASSVSVLSLEKLTNRDDEAAATLAELADDDPGIDPEQVAAEGALRRCIAAAIRRLPERERRIICDYYLRACSLQSIARAMAISEGRASQLRDRGIRRIRQELI